MSALWSEVGIRLLRTPSTEDQTAVQSRSKGMEIDQILLPLSDKRTTYSTSYPAELCPGDCLMRLAGVTTCCSFGAPMQQV